MHRCSFGSSFCEASNAELLRDQWPHTVSVLFKECSLRCFLTQNTKTPYIGHEPKRKVDCRQKKTSTTFSLILAVNGLLRCGKGNVAALRLIYAAD